MKVESASFAPTATALTPEKVERLEDARKGKETKDVESAEKAGVPPEEFLDKIKGLTDNGVYSVRFENDDTVNDLVVKIVDQETDEVIRQVPAEEILELRATLEDLRGNVVDTQG